MNPHIQLSQPELKPLVCPECAECLGKTRLVGIEPHPRFAETDLCTYECTECGTVQTVAIPLPPATEP
jgi:RNase P subunit RPR2